MLQIGVVDDSVQYLGHIKECISFFSNQEKIQVLVDCFESAEVFLANYEPKYDIVLLDIEMPDMDGITAAKKLREKDNDVIIMFVTNMAQFALSGYSVNALDYIIKPIEKSTFALKLRRAALRCEYKGNDYIVVNIGRELVKVNKKSIQYIDISGHYVNYYTMTKNYSEYSTLKQALKKIDSSNFIYCNRYYIVNMRYVDAIKDDTIILSNGISLEISRSHKKNFVSSFLKFVGGAVDA